MVKVSVIVPVYNESESIERLSKALDSQDFWDMEIIFVIDKKTTDDSIEKIKEMTHLLKEHSILVQKGNGVLGEARNLGLDAAIGDYVWFLDADDIPYPDFMDTMYGMAKEYEADVCQCNFVRSSNVQYEQPKWDTRINVMMGNEALYFRAKELIPVTAWSMMIRKDLLIDNGIRFIEGSYAEDIDFIYRVLEKCDTYCYCDKPMYLYYQNPSSICFTKQNERGTGEVIVYSDLYEYFDGNEGFKKTFGRRSALMRVRSAAHMDKEHFIQYIKSEDCKDMMQNELSDPLSLEYVWLNLYSSSYYLIINIFLKFMALLEIVWIRGL